VVLWGLVLFLALLVAALARQIGVLHMRLGPRGALEVDEEGPPLGEVPPPLEVVDLEGAAHQVGPGAPSLLLFVSPGCPICREVLPGVAPAARAGDLRPLVLVDDDRPATLDLYREHDPRVPVAAAPHVADTYDIPGTPFAVVLDVAGAVRAKGTVNTLEQMEGLVDTARRRLAQEPVT